MTPKENLHAFFEGGNWEWKPVGTDKKGFQPKEICEYVARAFVKEQEPFDNTKGGGLGWFNIEWEYEPGAGGSISIKPILDEVSEWKEKMVFPNLDEIDWEDIAKRHADYLNTDLAIEFTVFTGYFERLISLLSFEEAAMELIMEDYEEDIQELFTALTDFYIDFAQRFRKYFNADWCIIHDDWGTQRSAFFSPLVHKKMIVPHLTRFVSECHKVGLLVEMHSCGFIEELIPNLISTGIDSWAGQGIVDKRKLINEFGDQFKFEVITNPAKPFTEDQIEEAEKFAHDLFDEFKD
ncbi:MAG: hypothetical protein J5535_02665, partial [Firmicutes bacterium]|nr:hypothetical protein [Bacillota bacterium]